MKYQNTRLRSKIDFVLDKTEILETLFTLLFLYHNSKIWARILMSWHPAPNRWGGRTKSIQK